MRQLPLPPLVPPPRAGSAEGVGVHRNRLRCRSSDLIAPEAFGGLMISRRVAMELPLAAALVLGAFAPRAGAQRLPNLAGVWEDVGGNVHEVTQRGQSVVIVFRTPTAESRNTFGFAAGDTAMVLTLSRGSLAGKMHLHYEKRLQSKCPRQWDFWDNMVLTLEDSASAATGEWRNTTLDSNCVVKRGNPPMQGWYMVRPMVAENLTTKAFVADSDQVLVVNPTLPRFFVDDKGHASVDLAAAVLSQTNSVDVQMMRGDETIQSLRVTLTGLRPSALSKDRWFTLDFNDLLAGRVAFATPTPGGPRFSARALYGETEPFTLRVVTPSGAVLATSPRIDRWQLLDFMHQRAEWLSTTLYRFPLVMAFNYTSEEREGVAWRTFTNYRRPEVTVHLRNRGTTTTMRDAPVRLYALFNNADSRSPGHPLLLDQTTVTLAPHADTTLTLYGDTLFTWLGSRLAVFRGIYIAADTDSVRVVGEIEDRVGLRKLFTVDPLEPWRMAARDIKDHLPAQPSTAQIVAQADDYIATPVGSMELVQRAHASAVEWSNMIAEFDALNEQRRALFASDDLGKLHDDINEKSKDYRLHIGLPITTGGPTIRDPNSTIGYTRTTYILETPGWERFKAGVMSFATGGVAAGEVPLPESVNPAVDLTAAMQPRWRDSRTYADAFRDIPTRDLQALADRAVAENPQGTQLQGEIGEALATRYVGRQIAEELAGPNTKTLYIPGDRIKDYTYDSQTNTMRPRPRGATPSGSMGSDGLVLASSGRRDMRMTNLETKSGNSTPAVDGAPDQVARNEGRIVANGLTVLEPRPEEIEFFTSRGFTVRQFDLSISERPPVRVMHVQQGILKPNPTLPRVVVIASEMPDPETPNTNYRLVRLPASSEDIKRIANDLLSMRGVSRRLRLNAVSMPPGRVSHETIAAAAMLAEWAAAGAQEAERVGRMRLRVTVCRFDDSKQTWIGVQRGTLGTEGTIDWEPGYRDPSVQKMLLSSWYRSSRSLWTSGETPPWLNSAPADGTGDRCD
jgi:hypothetical protein